MLGISRSRKIPSKRSRFTGSAALPLSLTPRTSARRETKTSSINSRLGTSSSTISSLKVASVSIPSESASAIVKKRLSQENRYSH